MTLFLRAAAMFAILSALPTAAHSFHEVSSGGNYLDLRLYLNFGANYRKNPVDAVFYEDFTDNSTFGVTRLIAVGKTDGALTFDMNILAGAVDDSAGDSVTSATGAGVERSGAFEWRLKDEGGTISTAAVDHFNVGYAGGNVVIKGGRQPVNFATTYYFTPNDLFAPFSAETFYRVYKPGVDALRFDIPLGEFSTVTLVYVQGYEKEGAKPSGWGTGIDPDRSSGILRGAAVVGDFEYGFLAGEYVGKELYGFSLQGELYDGIGLRGEGNMSKSDADASDYVHEASVGIDRRFESTLNLSAEYFYHGSGFAHPDDYTTPEAISGRGGYYLGKHYFAAGASYEFGPLLNGSFLYMTNLDDRSALMSAYFVYSVSNEGELSFSFLLPYGDEPTGFNLKSEFGAAPTTLSAEYRIYF